MAPPDTYPCGKLIVKQQKDKHHTTMPEYIDLGVSHEVKEESFGKPHKAYPCTYITSKEPIDFGDAGTAEIKYRLIEKTERSRDGEDEYRYELELHGIAPLEAEEIDEEEDAPKRKSREGLTQNFGDMLDKAKKRREEY
jgi:hypothetical protein